MRDVKMKYQGVSCVQKLLRIIYLHGYNNNTVYFISGQNTRWKLSFVFDFFPGLRVHICPSHCKRNKYSNRVRSLLIERKFTFSYILPTSDFNVLLKM